MSSTIVGPPSAAEIEARRRAGRQLWDKLLSPSHLATDEESGAAGETSVSGVTAVHVSANDNESEPEPEGVSD